MSDLGNKQIMSKNLHYYMSKTSKTRKDVCEALKVSYSTFSDWYNGNAYPRIDKIEMLANYFGVTKSDLVEDKTSSPQEGMIDLQKEIERYERSLQEHGGLMFSGIFVEAEDARLVLDSFIADAKIAEKLIKNRKK